MNKKIIKRLNKIETENNIWIIYLLIILLSYYANSKEKDYFINNNLQSKDLYRKINIIIFIILIMVYSYFELDAISSLKDNNKTNKIKKLDNLSFMATTAVLISGILFLYILIEDEELEEEIAFN